MLSERTGCGASAERMGIMRLFDLHCDTLYECYTQGKSLGRNDLQLDLTRGLRYDVWAQCFAVWMPDSLRGETAYAQCVRILEFAKKQAECSGGRMRLIRTAAELEQAAAAHQCAALLTIEGGSALAGRLEALDAFSKFGVRAITLTWNGENELGYGSGCGKAGGLTRFGKQAVKRMEERGILPDVSHLNERGFWDVMDNTTGPVIASHSDSASVHPHERNLTDEQFRALIKRGGLVGLNLCGAHLGEQNFDCLRRHLDRYLSLGGERNVAFGCDLDGTDLPPEWEGLAVMERICEWLGRKNYEESLIDRLFFSNCYDFFTAL